MEPLRKLALADHLLLILLLAWIAVFALHVRGALWVGLHESPAIVVPAASAEAYPVIGGFRLELARPDTDLRVGDRVIEVGRGDARGLGYLAFLEAAAGRAGPDHRVRLLIERDGQRREVQLQLKQPTLPWARIPVLLATAFALTLILLRSPDPATGRLAFGAAMTLLIFQTPFPGPTELQMRVHQLVFHLSGGFALGLVAFWASRFPPELAVKDRVPAWLPWCVGLGWYVPRSLYVLGGPAFFSLPVVTAVFDALYISFLIGLWIRSYRRVDAIGQRRFKWLVAAMMLAAPPLIGMGIASVAPGLERFVSILVEVFAVTMLIVPVALLIAIVRFNLLDIDRLLSTTATWGSLLIVLVAAIVAVVPPASAAVAESFELDGSIAGTLVSVALASVLVPIGLRFRPALDRLMRREQVALEEAMGALMRELSAAETPGDVATLLGERLEALVRPTACAVHADAGGHFPAVWQRNTEGTRFEGEGELVARLRPRSEPLRLQGHGFRPGPDPVEGRDGAVLAAAGMTLALPVRRGSGLAGFVLLGRKRSGDVYTSTDEALLAAVAARAGDALLRFEDAQIIEQAGEREVALRAETQAAKEESEAKTRFLASASHDLRQPLNALGLLADSLAEKARDPELQALARNAQQTARGMSEMFDAILDVSRLDAGATVAQPEDLQLGSLLVRIVTDLQPEAEARGLGLRVVPSSVVARSDPVLLRRIVQNLIANALRYTERGSVLVGVRRGPGEAVRIEVWDTGVGIPEDRRSGIFREYERLAGGREGLGLGLAIVRRFADLLGHGLSLDSTPGRGSVFRVTLQSTDRTAAPEAQTAKPTVLVLSADEANRSTLCELLEGWGCRVIRASSSEEARSAIDATDAAVDACFADAASPLEQLFPTLPPFAVLVPAGVESSPLDDAATSGGPLRLTSPVSAPRLRAALRHLLDTARL